MSEIRSLTWTDVDADARLKVEESLSQIGGVTIGGLAPVRTGFGLRLHVPLSEAQMDDETRDPGIFVDLTFEQALDFSTQLVVLLAKQAEGR